VPAKTRVFIDFVAEAFRRQRLAEFDLRPDFFNKIDPEADVTHSDLESAFCRGVRPSTLRLTSAQGAAKFAVLFRMLGIGAPVVMKPLTSMLLISLALSNEGLL
jgi:hypothetical protein